MLTVAAKFSILDTYSTTQKMKFTIKDFLMENFIFCAVQGSWLNLWNSL